MVDSIEERARQYATMLVGGEYVGGCKGNLWQAAYDTYIEIATEQSKIDIENACDFMRNFTLPNGVAPLYDYTGNLRKAMEE